MMDQADTLHFTGVSGTDTHQQESEYVYISITISVEKASGGFRLAFGSSLDGPDRWVDDVVEFTGMIERENPDDRSCTARIIAQGRAFRCHMFDARELFLSIDEQGAVLREQSSKTVLKLHRCTGMQLK
jgi:hypothetical protein